MRDPLASLPLSAFRVFEAAARLGSFTRAAAELGMTQAAVSWQVKALEQRLDQPLFRRLPREVQLTAAGERLARAATEAMTALRGAVADISDTGEGVLSITTLQTLATLWLAGRLGRFQVAHPDIAVRLDSDSGIVDLLRGQADVAIRSSRRSEWPGMEAVLLFPSAQTVLATPEAMARLPADPQPADLLGIQRVGTQSEWGEWFRNAGVETDGSGADEGLRITADTQVLEVAAAQANGGIAMGSPVMFAAEIAAGRLVQPFEVYIAEEGGYWLVYPKDRRRARKIAAFRDWLLAQVEADPAAQKLLRRRAPE
ncbi:MAG: LysR family transcriptional regulator [Phenylobacterium zucineum]|nr:MAG: LysR family transcriptional regulator [Phenylobacterium zucineum]